MKNLNSKKKNLILKLNNKKKKYKIYKIKLILIIYYFLFFQAVEALEIKLNKVIDYKEIDLSEGLKK